ncbi:SDR family NAD(P)-dependent oxidoreductase [Gordonia sp. N1V]|uniref:SDR family NAD(P)-dependent oxidoreductase n=1 Tax=Gordonia sp. N1V TaxID=3034163 RepID=UPI0023E10078|nr:SDR family NAD(P)-dependent oxidoreductase [Gordonia sp. N1V]MDF3283000.1 SDR family NAD(P)-dependent oxidoreductase [Gordonia sp. N1V]
MGILDGRVVLITGAGSGLGRAITERFIAEGARVGVLELSEQKAKLLADEFGDRIKVTVGNTSHWPDDQAAVAATLEAFGHLDTFIGNAGLWDFHASLRGTSATDLDSAFTELFNVNVKGHLLGAKASVEALVESGGSMIFTLSNAATMVGGGGPLYTATKHALVGMVRQLAFEFGGAVRVNGIAPGGMPTDLRGLATLGQENTSFSDLIDSLGGPEDMAKMGGMKFFPTAQDYVPEYLMLASPESRVANGVIFETHGMLVPPPLGHSEDVVL